MIINKFHIIYGYAVACLDAAAVVEKPIGGNHDVQLLHIDRLAGIAAVVQGNLSCHPVLMRHVAIVFSRSDEGCIVSSQGKRDNWNAIDPNFVIDDQDQPWLVWGSFWDGIQLVRLDTTMHVAAGEQPRTIARRYSPNSAQQAPNPTSKYAGTNAIEAPFVFRHDGWYYLFVSWDYCCQGSKSNYRVAVGRSRSVAGPYLDRNGIDMRYGGGTLFLEGDKQQYEAAGHCAVYHFDGEDVFICHGYSIAHQGASILVQRPIHWTADGWPTLEKIEELKN